MAAVGVMTIIAISYFTLPTLTIFTTPEGCKIFINDSFYSESPYKLRLKKDSYQIKITNENYENYVETINLTNDKNMNINLKPKQDSDIIETPINHALTLTIGETQNNYLLSIDRNTSQLIKIDDKSTTIVHSELVSTFDRSNHIVALIEKNKPDSIVFINMETNEKQRITPKKTITISALSMSPSSNDVFVLGNIDTINRTSGLYNIKSNDEDFVKITNTKATSIKALSEQFIVEFAYADYNNASITSLLDTFSNKVVFSEPGNSFSVSPDSRIVAVFNSEKITMFSYKTQSQTEHKMNRSYFAEWLNSETILLFSNGLSGIEYSLLDIKNNNKTEFKKVASLGGVYIKSINGITNSNIYLTSVNGTLYNISRPIIETLH